MFSDEGAVVVASTYTKVGGVYDFGFRHDPDHPLETLADYCLGCYTNLGLPSRVELLERYIREYEADGFLINSVKSCNSFSAGQLLMLREVEKRTGVPGAFIESDLVDPRYFSAANIKNRIESYLQMLEQKPRRGLQPRRDDRGGCMSCVVGIDLGSTTTKAVVLDEKATMLGRGITNSRSNYDVACAVVRDEAFINARFGLIHQKAARRDRARRACAGTLRRAFVWSSILDQLARPRQRCSRQRSGPRLAPPCL